MCFERWKLSTLRGGKIHSTCTRSSGTTSFWNQKKSTFRNDRWRPENSNPLISFLLFHLSQSYMWMGTYLGSDSWIWFSSLGGILKQVSRLERRVAGHGKEALSKWSFKALKTFGKEENSCPGLWQRALAIWGGERTSGSPLPLSRSHTCQAVFLSQEGSGVCTKGTSGSTECVSPNDKEDPCLSF